MLAVASRPAASMSVRQFVGFFPTPLLFTEIIVKKGDADRRAQACCHYVYRHGGLQRAEPARRQGCPGIIGGTPPVVTRNFSAVSRHRNQNHRRRFPSRIRERAGSG